MHDGVYFWSLNPNAAVRARFPVKNKNTFSTDTSQIFPLNNPLYFLLVYELLAEDMQKTIAKGGVIKDQIGLLYNNICNSIFLKLFLTHAYLLRLSCNGWLCIEGF